MHHPITERLGPLLKGCPPPSPALRNVAPLLALLCLEDRWVNVCVTHGTVLSSCVRRRSSPVAQRLLTNKKARFPSEASLHSCSSTPMSGADQQSHARTRYRHLA